MLCPTNTQKVVDRTGGRGRLRLCSPSIHHHFMYNRLEIDSLTLIICEFECAVQENIEDCPAEMERAVQNSLLLHGAIGSVSGNDCTADVI